MRIVGATYVVIKIVSIIPDCYFPIQLKQSAKSHGPSLLSSVGYKVCNAMRKVLWLTTFVKLGVWIFRDLKIDPYRSTQRWPNINVTNRKTFVRFVLNFWRRPGVYQNREPKVQEISGCKYKLDMLNIRWRQRWYYAMVVSVATTQLIHNALGVRWRKTGIAGFGEPAIKCRFRCRFVRNRHLSLPVLKNRHFFSKTGIRILRFL